MQKMRKISFTILLPIAVVLATAMLSVPAFAGEECDCDDKDCKCSSYAFLGVVTTELDDALREALDFEEAGVLIEDVVKGSAAEEAGLKEGDIIMELAGTPIFTVKRLSKTIKRHDPGEKVGILLFRKGKKMDMNVALGEKKHEKHTYLHEFHDKGHKIIKKMGPKMKWHQKKSKPDVWLGVMLDDLNEQLGEYFGVKKDMGILVTEVFDGSPAMEAGLKAGDVIIDIAGIAIEEVSDVHEVFEEKEPGDEVDITVMRDRKKTKIKATLGEYPEDMDYGWNEFGQDIEVMVEELMDDIDIDLDDLKLHDIYIDTDEYDDDEIIILDEDRVSADEPLPMAWQLENGNLVNFFDIDESARDDNVIIFDPVLDTFLTDEMHDRIYQQEEGGNLPD